MKVTEHSLENDLISVRFDENGGFISSVTDKYGNNLAGICSSKAVVIDDSENDTWGHDHYVFDKVIGEFTDPTFEVLENGPCEVSLRVTTSYKNSTIAQTFTLYAGDDRIHVKARLILNEETVQVKLIIDSGIKDAEFIREVPGGVVCRETFGYEQPMLRWMAAVKANKGIAVINDSKYSSSIKDGVLAFIAARSCCYADHSAKRDNRDVAQDIGVNEFSYDIKPYTGELADIFRAAESLNTEFPVIHETYHYGTLPQTASNISIDCKNVTVSAVKPAEDGRGIIVRLTEIAGRETEVTVEILGTKITAKINPFDIHSYRIADGNAVRCDFTEKAK